MARTAFSIRFPAELAAALDRIAGRLGLSRSDLVETLLRDLDAEDRETIVKTTVVGAPTEKKTLRLTPDALQQLRRLAGELKPSDFLRRTVAYVVQMVPGEERQEAAPSGNGHQPASPRIRRGPHAPRGAPEDSEVGTNSGGAGLLVVPVLLAFGALIAFIVWVVYRLSSAAPPRLADDRRGQLPPGPAEAPDA